MKIKYTNISSLIDDVILKYECKYLVKYIIKEEDKYKQDILLTKFLIMFFDDNQEKLTKNFIDLLDFYNSLEIPCCEIKYSLAKLLISYKNWLNSRNIVSLDYYKKVRDIYKNIFNEYVFNIVENPNQFFCIEDEGVEETINEMHYNDKEKISAKTYFEQNQFANNDIEEILFLREDFSYLLDKRIEYHSEFIEEFKNLLQKLDTTLKFFLTSKEFIDIGFVLNKFIETLKNIEITKDKEEFVFNMFITFINDIIKWLDTIFISQISVDIHYFDASFLANVEQFNMMFQTEEDNEDEDDFLF